MHCKNTRRICTVTIPDTLQQKRDSFAGQCSQLEILRFLCEQRVLWSGSIWKNGRIHTADFRRFFADFFSADFAEGLQHNVGVASSSMITDYIDIVPRNFVEAKLFKTQNFSGGKNQKSNRRCVSHSWMANVSLRISPGIPENGLPFQNYGKISMRSIYAFRSDRLEALLPHWSQVEIDLTGLSGS